MEGIEGIERKNSIDIRQAKVLYSYLQNEEDELSVNLGDIVTILDMSDNDWWQCECNGEIGLLPSNYLQIISEGSHIGEKEAEHDNIPHEISSPKPYPISQSDLPPGWKMFVDKESGDIYYHNEDTGYFYSLFRVIFIR